MRAAHVALVAERLVVDVLELVVRLAVGAEALVVVLLLARADGRDELRLLRAHRRRTLLRLLRLLLRWRARERARRPLPPLALSALLRRRRRSACRLARNPCSHRLASLLDDLLDGHLDPLLTRALDILLALDSDDLHVAAPPARQAQAGTHVVGLGLGHGLDERVVPADAALARCDHGARRPSREGNAGGRPRSHLAELLGAEEEDRDRLPAHLLHACGPPREALHLGPHGAVDRDGRRVGVATLVRGCRGVGWQVRIGPDRWRSGAGFDRGGLDHQKVFSCWAGSGGSRSASVPAALPGC